MKKLVALCMVFIIMLGTLSACGNSDEKKALAVIESFMSAVQKGDSKKYIACLDPDIQTIIESGTNSIGNALGISNAYGLSTSMSSLLNSAFSEASGIKISFKQKEIKSSKVSEENASFYIVYTISVESDQLEEKIEQDAVLEFKMVKKENKWYILSFSAVDESTDTEILSNGLNIQSGTNFSDGVAFIQYMDETGNYKNVAIDKTGKIIYELKDDLTISNVTSYINGIMVVGNSIYDKAGAVIASPDKSGYDEIIEVYNMPKNINGYAIATKNENSFSGDKYLYGVINNKGEWEVKLSEKGNWSISNYRFSWDQEEREILEDRLIVSETGYDSRAYDGETPGIYKYNTNGGHSTMDTKATFELLIPNVLNAFEDNFSDDVFIGYSFNDSDEKVSLYDISGKIIMDLSQYQISNPGFYYENEHLLIKINNGTGSDYLCLLNKDGKPAFDPIKLESNDNYFPLDKTGFVLEAWDQSKGNHTYKHYDYTGKITEHNDINTFHGFIEGLALVKNSSGQMYYINASGEKVIK